MNWLISLITGGAASAVADLVTKVAAPFLGYFTVKQNVDVDGFKTGTAADVDLGKAWLEAQVQIAQIRATQNMWWGARIIILLLAGLVCFHFGYVCLDSTPVFGHAVGSWKVSALPAPLDQWEGDIILSFFVLTPAAPVFSAAAQWLHRK